MNSQVLNGTPITDTSLVDLCALMNAASISNIPILLSAQSAGALVKAMTTSAPVQPVAVPAQAIVDAEMHGIGFLVDGVGVDPSRVTVLRPAAPVQPVAVPDGVNPIAPAICPITGRKFWGNIDHPERGLVATYGGPFDTYSIPYLSDDNELRVERFDQDAGDWVEGGEPCGWYSDEQPAIAPAAQGDAKEVTDERAEFENVYQLTTVTKNGWDGERYSNTMVEFAWGGWKARAAIAAKAAS